MTRRRTLALALACVMMTGGFARGATYDFGTDAGVDRFAYQRGVASGAIPPLDNTSPSGSFLPSWYNAIAASDNVRYDTFQVEGGIVAATRFVFTVYEPPAAIVQLDVLWEGGSNEDKPVTVWLWNAASGAYVEVGTQVAVLPPDGVISGTYTANAAEFIDANGMVTILVTCPEEGPNIATDYVSVTATAPFQCFLDADCSDGVFCNGVETCSIGTCYPGSPVVCDDGNACTVMWTPHTVYLAPRLRYSRSIHALQSNGAYLRGQVTSPRNERNPMSPATSTARHGRSFVLLRTPYQTTNCGTTCSSREQSSNSERLSGSVSPLSCLH